MLGKSTFGVMLHSGLLYSMWHSEFCHIWNFVAFGIMSHLGLCRSVLCRLAFCRIRGYVVRHNVVFGIMSHLNLQYVVQDCVVRRNVVWVNVVWRNVVRPTVGVSVVGS